MQNNLINIVLKRMGFMSRIEIDIAVVALLPVLWHSVHSSQKGVVFVQLYFFYGRY